jgi:hypothetical protein
VALGEQDDPGRALLSAADAGVALALAPAGGAADNGPAEARASLVCVGPAEARARSAAVARRAKAHVDAFLLGRSEVQQMQLAMMREAFGRFDADGHGRVSRPDVRQALRRQGRDASEKVGVGLQQALELHRRSRMSRSRPSTAGCTVGTL